VAALAKPTVAAWVVNQLARRHPELVKKLGRPARACARCSWTA